MAPPDPYFSHWADHAATRTIAANADAEVITVAAGITPSGVVHVGNFREIITVDLVARALRAQGKKVRFIYSWDDFDVFRKVPVGMPQQDMLAANLRKSIADVPDPYGELDSYASHNIAALEHSIEPLGIDCEFIRQSRRYRAGDYAEGIRQALQHSAQIKAILDQYRREPLPADWLPIAGFDPETGRDDLKFSWDPNEDEGWIVHYSVASTGRVGKIDLREGGDVKLLWRVDWPMRWAQERVMFEPGGKDHSSEGGSYDTAKQIVDQVYGGSAPQYVAYDFVSIKGMGGKISSSKGNVVTVADCLRIYEPKLLRWLFASTRPNTEFAISFDLDVLKIYEDYDRAVALAHEPEEGGRKDKKRAVARRTLELADPAGVRVEPGTTPPFQPSFRPLSMILQIYDGDIDRARAHYEDSGELRSDEERALFDARARCVWNWIDDFAPAEFCYRIREQPVVRELEDAPKQALARLVAALEQAAKPLREADLVPHMKGLFEGLELGPKEFFPLIYDLLIDREKGPKLTTLVTVMGAERALPLLAASL
ncbi:lysine--tRNA ligase [Pseudenhygromyxa sp. WMMC2535]|uniref:lysine--tRNA ligase n=1 Tax=Pseudenhygromyxa sp. WMMC2535 TaxID=2712867 RepID=UPI0015545727|nr:lysine--tRNA ligase [Pseudenhygromyxa sp. WMMC2535]NVB40196.1 lysine--tRNA ligase [Pseudenhygromyxa sp. WMMC2535]